MIAYNYGTSAVVRIEFTPIKMIYTYELFSNHSSIQIMTRVDTTTQITQNVFDTGLKL